MDREIAVKDGKSRCHWAETHPLLASYHDRNGELHCTKITGFSKCCRSTVSRLGLSWLTILKKREAFLDAFHHFNIREVAAFPDSKVDELMAKRRHRAQQA